VTFPVLAVAAGLLSGVSWATIVFEVALACIWQAAFLCGVLTAASLYKWGFFAFGCLAGSLLLLTVGFDGGAAVKRLGDPTVRRDFGIFYGCLQLTWSCFMTAVGVTDTGNAVGVTGAFVWFGILDLVMGPLFAFFFLYRSRSWDYGRLNMAFTQHGRVQQAGPVPAKQTPHRCGVV
jgi:bacteriorhodopsin